MHAISERIELCTILNISLLLFIHKEIFRRPLY